ncbi:ATP-dependent DNA helicase [Neobacillus terrae]|uniref:ATP-dependent DNA helicase n=1 Tax=Neobacillus terrae TaxID=3034837 RepID=UPI001407C6D3|nr:ATP-dependent DNA helicase [Neobacillus terrae]NHM29180.1 ATP-dependent DNA helicase [Neobacillus terrae]
MQNRMPFTIDKTESFYDRLGEWIGDVFYDLLPEEGFEIRDEQIYMAFQLEKAFKEKKTIFAEAGVGTGKTLVYLLYAICYARYTNKPAIITCADETLIEQLVKKEGDIAKLEKALNLNIDVRLAKSRDQYLCLKKLDTAVESSDFDGYGDIYDELPDFVLKNGTLKTFTRYGDRRDYAHLTDEQWKQVGWDAVQDCFACEKRHRCGQTLHREYYRGASDLIICSHDFYMEHVWTKESRKREGQLPLLPEHSCVVFDEGHLLEFAAQKALSYRFTEQTLEALLTRLMENDVREKTLYAIEDAIHENESFFMHLSASAKTASGSEKKIIEKDGDLLSQGKRLYNALQKVEEELVFDSEMYVINDYELKIVEEYLEQITYSLSLFLQPMNGITWFEDHSGERTLVIMPKMVQEIMKEEVFSRNMPFIFSSATLSEQQSFEYMAKSLGIEDYLSFTVASPFEYEEKMEMHLPSFKKDELISKAEYVIKQIKQTAGRALILANDIEEIKFLKSSLSNIDFPVYFEGDAEISTLVSKFQNEEQSVLCALHLWEGLDIPGRSLENVIVFSLPFPPNDPVFRAKREGAENPYLQVDLPYMLLRLRQGVGRLIRSHEDRGYVHILLNEGLDKDVLEKVKSVLPVEPLI